MHCDVCLLLEGTYPYVSGGVSTWVDQILQSMPDINFGIVYLGASAHETRILRYRIPPNVTLLREVFIHDIPDYTPSLSSRTKLRPQLWREFEAYLRSVFQGAPLDLAQLRELALAPGGIVDFFQEFAGSQHAWQAGVRLYKEAIPEGASFIDFFWTLRFINLPLLQLLRTPVVEARVYHSACTGYAGALGALFSRLTGAPLMVTEHGIYTRERRIEIFDADWICGDPDVPLSLDMARKSNFYKEWWVNFFLSLSRTAYDTSAMVYSLFNANRRDQISDGADANRLKIVPNGIEIARYRQLKTRMRGKDDPYIVGYIGRIAPIKDVKTLIRSLDVLKSSGMKFEALLMGPADEDEQYAAECQELVQSLGLSQQVVFTGPVRVLEWLPKVDVIVISSISEGLPFAILEAGCAALPVVSTDVGACRELLEGRTAEDKALGAGGIVVPVASPSELGAALARLGNDRELSLRMGESSRKRMYRYYDLAGVMHTYRQEYEYWFEMGAEHIMEHEARVRRQ